MILLPCGLALQHLLARQSQHKARLEKSLCMLKIKKGNIQWDLSIVDTIGTG